MSRTDPSPLPSALDAFIQAELIAPIGGAAVRDDIRKRLENAFSIAGRQRNGRLHHLASLWREIRHLGAAGFALAGACCLIVALFLTNSDMNREPDAVRGDGTYHPVLARGDGHMQYLMARSTALDGDWNFDNDLARFGDPWNEPRTKTGRKAIVHPIGPALVWTPLIWIAEAGAAVTNLFGARVPLHGYTLWHQRFVFLSSALFACGAALLGWRIARRILRGRWAATYGAVAVLLGTPLTYYATYMPSYAHAMDAFACAAFFSYWIATIGSVRRKRWFVLGLMLGVAMLVRVQNIASGIVIIVEVIGQLAARDARNSGAWRTVASRWIGGGCITLATSLVVFVPQLLEWHIVFGTITQLPQGAKYTRFEAPMLAELLWSARNGWFSSTPIAYAGVVGLLFLPKQSRVVAVGLLGAVAIQVYLNSTILDWWSSASFGQRRLCSVTLPLVIGLAALLSRAGHVVQRRRLALVVAHCVVIVVLGALVAWNLRRVRKLRGGKSAPQELAATCCSDVPAPLRRPARWIYDRVGNPFQFPASAVFGLVHDVPWSRWDQVVGDYPLIPSFADVRSNKKLVGLQGVWRVGSPNRQPWLLRGWSAPQVEERSFRYMTATEAVVLVPNLMPEPQHIAVWMRATASARVTVLWNGDSVASADLTPTWTSVTFELRAPGLHSNELTIRRELASDVRIDVADIELRLQ